MYITCLAASPCAKIAVFFGNSTTFLATPAESRKAWASKARLCMDFLLDLLLLELAITCITPPLKSKSITKFKVIDPRKCVVLSTAAVLGVLLRTELNHPQR